MNPFAFDPPMDHTPATPAQKEEWAAERALNNEWYRQQQAKKAKRRKKKKANP